jgi:hypothetical protein
MDENNICVGLPSPLPNKRDQASQSLARVDRIEGQGFERSGKLDGLDGRPRISPRSIRATSNYE